MDNKYSNIFKKNIFENEFDVQKLIIQTKKETYKEQKTKNSILNTLKIPDKLDKYLIDNIEKKNYQLEKKHKKYDLDHEHSELEPHVLPEYNELFFLENGTTSTENDPTSAEQAETILALHSNFGAQHTIYLDFDGHITSGTIWNSSFNNGEDIITDPYTTNAAIIEEIWQRVAEDFSPFNVNVTTVDPGVEALQKTGSSDPAWGIRVVIGGSSHDWFGQGAGGVAYYNSFDDSNDEPVFVFPSNLSHQTKPIAEAASHEVGHSLGLYHDGKDSSEYYSGHGTWAPIMGNSYSRAVTQWSKGEYTGATSTQDDLAIITSNNNGFGYREDEHGNTINDATLLTDNNGKISVSGIIERNTDFDVFAFNTGSGTVSFDILPAAVGANLDIKAELLDNTGQSIAISDPLNSLSASFTDVFLDAGQYFLSVTGTGKDGEYSDYGSIGQYSIAGNIVISSNDFLSINAITPSLNEGDSGSTTTFQFEVSRSGNLSTASSVQWQVSGDGDNPADAADFLNSIFASGEVQFAANESSQIITVDVAGDTELESDEGFKVTLLNPSTDTILSDNIAEATILTDDQPPQPPTVSISPTNISKNEGDSNTTIYEFTVSLDSSSEETITVNYSTNDISATLADNDYIDNDGVLTFNPGDITKTINVLVNGDTVVEGDESLSVNLDSISSNAILGNTQATGTIVNDDTPSTLAIADVTVNEGAGTATFTVTRSGNSNGVVTVGYSTSNGKGKNGATAGEDYQQVSDGLVTFNSGEVTKFIDVFLIDDSSKERDEMFYLDLNNASGADITDAQATATILDNDTSGEGGGGKGGGKPQKSSTLVGEDALTGFNTLTGIVGEEETFVLGDGEQAFYAEDGLGDYTVIENFTKKEDLIQLHGNANDYAVGASPFKSEDLGIYYGEELIGVVTDINNLSLNNPHHFTYIS